METSEFSNVMHALPMPRSSPTSNRTTDSANSFFGSGSIFSRWKRPEPLPVYVPLCRYLHDLGSGACDRLAALSVYTSHSLNIRSGIRPRQLRLLTRCSIGSQRQGFAPVLKVIFLLFSRIVLSRLFVLPVIQLLI